MSMIEPSLRLVPSVRCNLWIPKSSQGPAAKTSYCAVGNTFLIITAEKKHKQRMDRHMAFKHLRQFFSGTQMKSLTIYSDHHYSV